MLIVFRGCEYDSTCHTEASHLADLLGVGVRVAALQSSTNDQQSIDRALWLAILAAGPGSLTAAQLARAITPGIPAGVIACGPGGRRVVLPPQDIAVIEEFAALLSHPARGA